jgi:uncharacterized protein YdaU (DUF1376 family)
MKIHTVQLNLADFDKGTNGLSPLEFTIYTRLLLAGYERTLPDDNDILARIARVAKKDIKKVRIMIEEKFKKVDGFFQNPRTELEKERYKKISEKNKENANERWRTKDLTIPSALPSDSENNINDNANAMLTNNQHLITNTNKEETPKSFFKSTARAEGVKKIGDLVGGVGKRFLKVLDVTGQLTTPIIEEVKRSAPGWDIEYLAKIYIDGINSGKREPPASIPKAFPKWCGKYTKGKPPN